MSTVPFMNITVVGSGDRLGPQVRILLRSLRPSWDMDKVQYQIPSTGILSVITIYHLSEDTELNDAIVIKTHEDKNLYVAPVEEIHKICRFVNDRDLGAKTLLFFSNGFCMEYIKGEAFDWNSSRFFEESVWRALAEELARWHCKDTLQHAMKSGIRQVNVMVADVDKYWDEIMAREPMSSHREQFPTKSQLISAEKTLREELMAIGCLDMAFCHSDIQTSNMILTSDNKIKLVDHDFNGISFLQYDLAFFFGSFIDLKNPGLYLPLDEVYQINFLRHYLKCLRRFNNESEAEESEVMTLYRQVQIVSLFVHLRLIVGSPFVGDFKNLTSLFPLVKQLWIDFPLTKRKLLESFL